jgi:hypothetical protein
VAVVTATISGVSGKAVITAPLTNLPDTSSQIGLALTGGTNYPSPDPNNLVSRIGYVMWGGQPSGYLSQVANHSRYCKLSADSSDDPDQEAWIRTNHPDWIVYLNDRVTPAYYNAGGVLDTFHVPLDLSNPAVQDFIANECAGWALAGGYTSVGYDHGTTLNPFGVAGHFNTAGGWVQLYSGNLIDPVYRKAKIAAFAAIATKTRKDGRTHGVSLTVALNDYPNLRDSYPDYWMDVVPYVDVVFDEAGFTLLGGSSTHPPYLTSTPQGTDANPWLTKIQGLQRIQSEYHKPVIINATELYTISPTQPPKPVDVEWVLANYLLIRGSRTYTALLGTKGSAYDGLDVTVPAYATAVGSPSSGIHNSGGVYWRSSSTGFAAVNPSATQTLTLTLPSSNYSDIYTGPAGASITLPPHTGAVLVKI